MDNTAHKHKYTGKLTKVRAGYYHFEVAGRLFEIEHVTTKDGYMWNEWLYGPEDDSHADQASTLREAKDNILWGFDEGVFTPKPEPKTEEETKKAEEKSMDNKQSVVVEDGWGWYRTSRVNIMKAVSKLPSGEIRHYRGAAYRIYFRLDNGVEIRQDCTVLEYRRKAVYYGRPGQWNALKFKYRNLHCFGPGARSSHKIAFDMLLAALTGEKQIDQQAVNEAIAKTVDLLAKQLELEIADIDKNSRIVNGVVVDGWLDMSTAIRINTVEQYALPAMTKEINYLLS